jgi:hypothetical protein
MSHDLLVKMLVAYYWIAVLISLLVEYRKKWPDYPVGLMGGLGWATIGLVMLASVMAFVS